MRVTEKYDKGFIEILEEYLQTMNFKKLKKNGFSLVELIVVVSIIGILSSIVIPSYQKFSAKTRQVEAKTLMTALFAAEKSFFAEYSSYHSSFSVVGFAPEGRVLYVVGFWDTLGNLNVDAGVANGYTGATDNDENNRSTWRYCDRYTGGIGQPGNQCYFLRPINGQSPLGIVPAINVTNFLMSVANSLGTFPPLVIPADPTMPVTGCIVRADRNQFEICAGSVVFGNYGDVWTLSELKNFVQFS